MPDDINFQEAMEAAGIKPLFIDQSSEIAGELDEALNGAQKMRRMTNVEFVTNIMEFCPFGAMSQIIVIQAVNEMCRMICETPIEDLDHPLINGEAYKRCAEWINSQYKQQYGD